MASRESHAADAQASLKIAETRHDRDSVEMQIEAAKVQATLAVAAAISEIAENLYKIKRGY